MSTPVEWLDDWWAAVYAPPTPASSEIVLAMVASGAIDAGTGAMAYTILRNAEEAP